MLCLLHLSKIKEHRQSLMFSGHGRKFIFNLMEHAEDELIPKCTNTQKYSKTVWNIRAPNPPSHALTLHIDGDPESWLYFSYSFVDPQIPPLHAKLYVFAIFYFYAGCFEKYRGPWFWAGCFTFLQLFFRKLSSCWCKSCC